MRKYSLPPTPEVHYLQSLFRRVDAGEIRIPAFQRSFVWEEAEILSLLESVYNGYPIGSMLFWKVDERKLNVTHNPESPFPNLPEKYPLTFVLDGMQRITTLYGVFYCANPSVPSNFNYYIDLATDKFFKFEGTPNETSIPLSSIFQPKELLSDQKRLSTLSQADLLIEKSVDVLSVFQEYLVPTVTITGREVTEVVEIFERINNTGIKLSSVDFIRALVWSEEFDLTRELEAVKEELDQLSFPISVDTLVKCLSVTLDLDPLPDAMLNLRDFDNTILNSAVADLRVTLRRIIGFLETEFKILSSEYIPYEGLLLGLVRLFRRETVPCDLAIQAVKRWFWTISFSEGLRGKPDNVVARFVRAVDRVSNGDYGALSSNFELSSAHIIQRRYTKGKALSAAISASFAVNNAKSLFSGEVIPAAIYMNEFNSENFKELADLMTLKALGFRNLSSSRLFANLILVTEEENLQYRGIGNVVAGIEALFASNADVAEQALMSQFISLDAFSALKQQDFKLFFNLRASKLLEFAQHLSLQS